MPRAGTMLYRGVPALLAIFVAVAGSRAEAAKGWFAGAEVGASAWRHYALSMEADEVDDSDRGGFVTGGYRFGPHFAVSVGAVELGRLEARGRAFGGFEESLQANGLNLMLKGILPLGSRLDLVGSFGFFHWRHKARYVDDRNPFPVGPLRLSSRGSEPCYGVGLGYSWDSAQRWSVRTEWNRFLDVGEEKESLRSNDVDLFTAGVLYRFTK